MEKFENLQNQKELELLIEKFWQLDIEERLEIIDNLDSIMTLVSSKELDNIIFSLFGCREDYLSKSVVNDFYSEDIISKGNFASEVSRSGKVKLYRNSITKETRKRDSGLGKRRSSKRKVLNLMKADRKSKVTKQERLRRVRSNLQDFIFKENSLRKKMLRVFPLILQKIYRTRNESFLKNQHHFNRQSFVNPNQRRESMQTSSALNSMRFSIRGSYQHIPEVTRPKGPTITLKRLSNKKMLKDNMKMFGYRDSDLAFQNYLDRDSDCESDYSIEPVVEHQEEVQLLRTMLSFVIRRYKEHREVKNIILCFESMRQIFSFCPKRIFHLVGLETVIDLLYNHIQSKSESVVLDKKVV